MSALVDTISAWVWIAAGCVAIIAGIYGAVKWARKQLKDVVVTDIQPSLEHLHDCVERITAAVATQADAAVDAAAKAQEEATKARSAADEAQAAVEHITEWQATVDLALRNIQQAQIVFPSPVDE